MLAMMRFAVLLPLATPLAIVPPCSLNGELIAGACKCDPGWEGKVCERVRFLAANLSHGFNSWAGNTGQPSGTSSWGATQLRGDDGLWHTWIDEMDLQCGLLSYQNNMQIVHATSNNRLGPWQRHGPVSPFASSAVTAHAVRDPASKKFLIFHTGCGNHSDPNSVFYGTNHSMPIVNCKNGTTPKNKIYAPTPPPGPAAPGNATCGHVAADMSIFVSESPYGPWTQQMPWVVPGSGTQEINGVPWAKGIRHVKGNPTALILENGTTLVFFRRYIGEENGKGWKDCVKLGVVVRNYTGGFPNPENSYPGCTVVGLARAPHWSGPYEIVGGPAIPFQQEDFYMYRTKRGFHAVFHGMDPWPSRIHTGRHAYSEDGITWHGGDVDCWNNTVHLVDGITIELKRRERPEMLHDEETGLPFALINAVHGPDDMFQKDQSFTMVQAIDTSGDSDVELI